MAQNSIPGAVPATATLLAAYLAARYRVQMGEGLWLALEPGRPTPPGLAQALPCACPGLHLTLVTAWNPQSTMRTTAANAAADAVLRAELEASGRPALRAMATDPDGGHAESGWLVAGLETAAADALARRHGQAGVLHWRADGPVRLRMYRPRPVAGADDARSSWVDWADPPP